MKKVLKISIIAVMLFAMVSALASCGGKTPAVSDIVKAVTDKYPMSSDMMHVKSADTLSNTYGFEKADYSDIAVYTNKTGTTIEDLIIVKASDSSKASNIKEVAQTYLDNKKSSTKNYLPDQYKIVSKCSVKTSGDYVYLVISKNADKINSIIDSQLN